MPILTPSPVLPTVPHDPMSEPEPRAAAERLVIEMADLPEADVSQVHLNVMFCVTQVLGAWPKLSQQLPAIAELKGVDVPRVQKLREYALNLYFWQASCLYSSTPAGKLTELVEQGTSTRDRILADLTSLAGHGVIAAAMLQKFKGTKEHLKIGEDLLGLSNLVHEHWANIEGKSLLTLAAMDDAARLGHAIMEALGERKQGPQPSAHATLQRDKAFTLFIRSYDEARRAVSFLRWHSDDADTFLPSLYNQSRRSGKKKEDAEPETAAQPAAPAQASTLIVSAPAAAGGAASEPFTRD